MTIPPQNKYSPLQNSPTMLLLLLKEKK